MGASLKVTVQMAIANYKCIYTYIHTLYIGFSYTLESLEVTPLHTPPSNSILHKSRHHPPLHGKQGQQIGCETFLLHTFKTCS